MVYFMEELGLRRLQLTKVMKEHSRVLGLSVDNKLRLNVRVSQCLRGNGDGGVSMNDRTPPADPRCTLLVCDCHVTARAGAETVTGVQHLCLIVLVLTLVDGIFPHGYIPCV